MHVEVIITPEIIAPNLIHIKVLDNIIKTYASTVLKVPFLNIFG